MATTTETRWQIRPDQRSVYDEIAALEAELAALPPEPLAFTQKARPSQLAPDEGGPWAQTESGIWYVRGSRGSGKTWTGSGQLATLITESPPLNSENEDDDDAGEWGIVAPTIADVRDTCFEGPSGLIRALGGRVSHGKLLRTGPYIQGWNRSMTQLYLWNGETVYGASAEDGADRIQGKNLRGLWGDEIGLWQNWETAWDEAIKYALRKSPALLIATATPKMNQKSRALIKRLLNDPAVAKSFLPLESNADNLDPKRVEEMLKLRGTRLGRQEVGGELVEDIEGAYFFQSQIDDDRIYDGHPLLTGKTYKRPKRNLPGWLAGLLGIGLVRMVVAVDPAVTANEDSDETGIIVAALGTDGHGYVLEDLSGRYSPDEWAAIAVDAYYRWQADVIVGEVNNGGDMVGTTIKTRDADVPYRAIRATRGKILRAEPISAAYAQHRVHHVGPPEQWEALESQLTDCLPGMEQDHDDRLDANVYALTELGLAGGGMDWTEAYADGGDAKTQLAAAAREANKDSTRAVAAKALGEEPEDPDAPPDEDDPDFDPWAATYSQ